MHMYVCMSEHAFICVLYKSTHKYYRNVEYCEKAQRLKLHVIQSQGRSSVNIWDYNLYLFFIWMEYVH